MKSKILKIWEIINEKRELLTSLIIFIFIFCFLLSYFKPELIFSKTITTGGDTASHYYPATYLKNYLIPHGKLTGWCPGWFGGFPMFQFYFVLPYFLMSCLSVFIGLEIAFKIVTVLGTFLLPICAFFSMKFMKFKFPIPIIASIFTLPFLFIESYSMFGGNIPSTLAGQFSHSLSLAFTVLFFGSLYKGVEEKKFWFFNGILFALIILTHAVTMFFAFSFSLFFLINKDRKKVFQNFKYLFKMYIFSFLLTAFWLLPLLFNLEYSTSFSDFWSVTLDQAFPQIIIVFFPLVAFGFILELKNKRYEKIGYFAFSLLVGLFLYVFVQNIRMINIRFIPAIHLFLLLLCAFSVGLLLKSKKIKAKWMVPIIIFFIVSPWVASNVEYTDTFIEWNYKGFKEAPLWESYSEVNEFLSGDAGDPRVVFEFSSFNSGAGTVRAFESLPLFSGRSTMEGLFIESSITSPFIFCIQSEISEHQSCPLHSKYPCPQFDIKNGTEHLKLFNVQYFIVVSDKVKDVLKNNNEYQLVKKIYPYEIYELVNNKNSYVTIPEYYPVLFETNNWKDVSYDRFRDNDLEVPLVFANSPSKSDLEHFEITNTLENLSKNPTNISYTITENITNEEITFHTSNVGEPHIISISYHPNWKVEGASKIYLVSPSFMLVYPEQENVRIYYGESSIDFIGKILTIIGLLFVFYKLFKFIRIKKIIKFLKR